MFRAAWNKTFLFTFEIMMKSINKTDVENNLRYYLILYAFNTFKLQSELVKSIFFCVNVCGNIELPV